MSTVIHETMLPYLSIADNTLHLDGIDTTHLAHEYGTPLFVFSENQLRANTVEIIQAFQSYAAKTRIFYAAKANSNLALLQIIRDAGSGIEVNSGGELYKALQA